MSMVILGLMMVSLAARGAELAVLLKGSPQEKAAAAQAAGYAKDVSAVETLAKAVADADPVVAYAAAEALGTVGTDEAAEALLNAWANGTPAVLADGVLRCAEARREAKDLARARALYSACREKGLAVHREAALIGLASLDAPPAEAVIRPAQALMRDASEWVRLTGIHAAVRTAEDAAVPMLFSLSMKPGEEGRAATLAMSAMAAKETDAFLYGELEKTGPERVKAVELLAARGDKALVERLCDARLYAVPGVSAAAGGAWRTCLRQEDFASALAFAFGPLPEPQRDPMVSALGSVAQQLPDQQRVVREVGAQLVKTAAASKAELLGLLAGLQNEEARDLLAAQAKSGDAELRKAVVRVLTKWTRPLALDPLLALARQDADRSVRVLALRGTLALLQKPGVADKTRQVAVLAELAQAAERIEEKRAVYASVKAISGKEAEGLRKRLAEACGLANVQEHVVLAVNAGGGAIGTFQADGSFSGGSVYVVQLEPDTSDAVDAAPEAVYQSCRFRDMTYAFDGLKAGHPYTLRLHFAETYHEQAGARVFDVVANGQTLLKDYDILAKTGTRMKAVSETLSVTADDAGKVAIAFKTKRDQALVNGLELLETGAGGSGEKNPEAVGLRERAPGSAAAAGRDGGGTSASRPAGPPGQIRVLLLTGANNHAWQETTAALRALFASSPIFSVTVVESPWEMKPADLEGYDLIFNNWNTYGKDKREWTAEMKAAFIAWVKKGGGFFVLHAGGSMFYDWDEFQTLTGGAWEKGTFHPHPQNFTVNIADKTHPVTRGLADFETFDEPWQKIANRNPSRRVLAAGVVSKENKGSGEPEPFAFVTELGKGRCFNLVLGHDARALSHPGCKTLILRGAEWAATGDVK